MDVVLYLCENVSCHGIRLTVTLVPMLFYSDYSDGTCVKRANILYNSQHNGLFYDKIKAYCKVTDKGWEMETECIELNTKKDRVSLAVANSKQRWTRRKLKENFICYKKNEKSGRGYVHKCVDINPCKLYAIKGGQFVLSLIHKKKYCLYNNRCTNNDQIYEHRDHEILDLSSDRGCLVVDEPMVHDQIMHIWNHYNGQVEVGHYDRWNAGTVECKPIWKEVWKEGWKNTFNPTHYVPVSEDLANSIL